MTRSPQHARNIRSFTKEENQAVFLFLSIPNPDPRRKTDRFPPWDTSFPLEPRLLPPATAETCNPPLDRWRQTLASSRLPVVTLNARDRGFEVFWPSQTRPRLVLGWSRPFANRSSPGCSRCVGVSRPVHAWSLGPISRAWATLDVYRLLRPTSGLRPRLGVAYCPNPRQKARVTHRHEPPCRFNLYGRAANKGGTCLQR